MTIGGALLIVLIAITAGCEDSDVTAPAGSVITLIPSPAAVFIDQDGGKTSGTATLIAQVVDQGGLPLADIPLFFTTDGGLLASADNICIGNVCSRTAMACSDDPGDACEELPSTPQAIETDTSGVAIDILLLRLIEDPDSVEVTVQGTNLSAIATVPKTVNVGTDPVANIEMSPSAGQLTGEIFLADGTGSVFDLDADPTCYEWTINSSLEATVVRRGPNLSILPDLVRGVSGEVEGEQTLTISLKVSDRASIIPACIDNPPEPPEADLFSDFPASVTYLIRCDVTAPNNVDAGPDRFLSLGGNPDVSVTLSAIGSDPEFPDLQFNWNCIDAFQEPPGEAQSVTCTYLASLVGQSLTAEVTVTNECGLSVMDSLTVHVLQ